MRRILVGGLLIIAVGCLGLLGWWIGSPSVSEPTFVAPLREMRSEATFVAPTLDIPLPEGKSALWCASFQLAWERLREDVTKGPVGLVGAEDVVARLNAAPFVAGTVRPDDVFAAAGFVRDGIGPTIRQEMTRRFPEVPVLEFQELPGGAVAYAYIRASIQFTHPFLENHARLEFVAADGSKKAVQSFGLPSYVSRRRKVTEQVKILHASRGERLKLDTFVIDPSKDSSPYQMLIARIPRGATLNETLADMERRIAGPNKDELLQPMRFLDSMAIPHMRFRTTHHFKELEGKKLAEQGMTLELAVQQIEFRLDASGVILQSQSTGDMPKSDPRHFYNDRPFL